MLPVMKGKDLVAFLETLGFLVVRQKGSHIRMKSDDGRNTTVPVHSGEVIPKGLMRKIIREDLGMTPEDFVQTHEHYKGH
jgi:predicted RNA binding protein YcfA (HicA-like mRNA interferase family)